MITLTAIGTIASSIVLPVIPPPDEGVLFDVAIEDWLVFTTSGVTFEVDGIIFDLI